MSSRWCFNHWSTVVRPKFPRLCVRLFGVDTAGGQGSTVVMVSGESHIPFPSRQGEVINLARDSEPLHEFLGKKHVSLVGEVLHFSVEYLHDPLLFLNALKFKKHRNVSDEQNHRTTLWTASLAQFPFVQQVRLFRCLGIHALHSLMLQPTHCNHTADGIFVI